MQRLADAFERSRGSANIRRHVLGRNRRGEDDGALHGKSIERTSDALDRDECSTGAGREASAFQIVQRSANSR